MMNNYLFEKIAEEYINILKNYDFSIKNRIMKLNHYVSIFNHNNVNGINSINISDDFKILPHCNFTTLGHEIRFDFTFFVKKNPVLLINNSLDRRIDEVFLPEDIFVTYKIGGKIPEVKEVVELIREKWERIMFGIIAPKVIYKRRRDYLRADQLRKRLLKSYVVLWSGDSLKDYRQNFPFKIIINKEINSLCLFPLPDLEFYH